MLDLWLSPSARQCQNPGSPAVEYDLRTPYGGPFKKALTWMLIRWKENSKHPSTTICKRFTNNPHWQFFIRCYCSRAPDCWLMCSKMRQIGSLALSSPFQKWHPYKRHDHVSGYENYFALLAGTVSQGWQRWSSARIVGSRGVCMRISSWSQQTWSELSAGLGGVWKSMC